REPGIPIFRIRESSRAGPAAGWSGGGTLRRRRPGFRLELSKLKSDAGRAAHYPGRGTGRLQRGPRRGAGAPVGRGCLLPHRERARQEGPQQNAAISAIGQEGLGGMTSQPEALQPDALQPDASQPDSGGHFGPYGGRYVPEVLMAPIEELEAAYLAARQDPASQAELADLL